MILGMTTGVCLVNIGLLAGLMFIYLHGYSQLKSRFGLGLLIFALLLMGQNLLYIYFYFAEWDAFGNAMVYVLTANLVQTFGLVVLSWVSWK
ncbi:MAG TPA: hypothetical protein VE177_06050 [Candidatus Binatus sp.]|nr:hypothetical protein [Candidatus Binatus sp.]